MHNVRLGFDKFKLLSLCESLSLTREGNESFSDAESGALSALARGLELMGQSLDGWDMQLFKEILTSLAGRPRLLRTRGLEEIFNKVAKAKEATLTTVAIKLSRTVKLRGAGKTQLWMEIVSGSLET